MKKNLRRLLVAPFLLLCAAASAQLYNTTNTLTIDVTGFACSAPPPGTYQLYLTWADYNDGNYRHDTVTVSVTTSGNIVTIDASSANVNWPDADWSFADTEGELELNQPGFHYILFWQFDYINCTPLGIAAAASSCFIRRGSVALRR